MLLKRLLLETIVDKLENSKKGVIVYGPRQVGKTTLIKQVLRKTNYKTLSVNTDQRRYVDVLSSRDLNKLKALVEGYELLFIDEAQRIPEIGINLKILLDEMPNLKIIATGSSSFDLANKVSEPLTGRVWTYKLYPVSFAELQLQANTFELNDQLEERLVYGSYPELFSVARYDEKKEYLDNLTQAYLFKDVLQLADIKNASKLHDLLKLLAFQLGSQVSLAELGNSLEMSKDTVARYIDLLEKSFVVFRLGGLSRNLRKEVAKMDKIYFYDLGVRNAIIDNLKPLNDRNDQGQLWENLMIVERMKLLSYTKTMASKYFWRTYTGAELDYIEERDGKLLGHEIKWSSKRSRTPKTWLKTYETAEYRLINRDNYLDFVLKV